MNNIAADRDILGKAVMDYHRTGKNKKINVLSSITQGEYIPSEYLFRNFDQMPKLEKEALSLCAGRILDVGACAGVHSLYLQDRGEDITALEKSGLCCEVMKERGLSKVIHSDFYNYSTEKYDTILLLMNGIGIAGQLSGLEPFLKHCISLLNNGGKIIFDSSDIAYMFEEEDGSHWVNLGVEYYGEVRYSFKYKRNESEEFDWLFVDYGSVEKIAKKLGLKSDLVMQGEHFDYLATLSLP